jgi:MEKHLA domain-containing protein
MRPDLERLLETSYRTVVGRDLRSDAGDNLYDAPAALLMHGTEADPLFCYANRTAQRLWGLTWDEFIGLPSRLSAEPLVQAERERLLARVRAHGFIDDYEGVRIAKGGTRFRIFGAVVWMVVVDGATYGQAALLREWAAA